MYFRKAGQERCLPEKGIIKNIWGRGTFLQTDLPLLCPRENHCLVSSRSSWVGVRQSSWFYWDRQTKALRSSSCHAVVWSPPQGGEGRIRNQWLLRSDCMLPTARSSLRCPGQPCQLPCKAFSAARGKRRRFFVEEETGLLRAAPGTRDLDGAPPPHLLCPSGRGQIGYWLAAL